MAELIAAYQGGAGVKELAARFGVHRETVSAIIRRSGVQRNQRGLTATQISQASCLYAGGWSLARLGDEYGVDGTTVWRALTAAGVPMRSPNERSA
jgi:transposase